MQLLVSGYTVCGALMHATAPYGPGVLTRVTQCKCENAHMQTTMMKLYHTSELSSPPKLYVLSLASGLINISKYTVRNNECTYVRMLMHLIIQTIVK